MLIRNDIQHMKVETEIKHIVNKLKLSINKIKCDNLVFTNKNILEDMAFIELYNNNCEDIETNLFYIGEKYNKYNENKKFIYIDDNNSLKHMLFDILENNNLAIVNTDTLFLEKIFPNKINYNIEIFKDYSRDFVKEILKFYKIDITQIEEENLPLSTKNQEILNDYINHIPLNLKYTKEEIKDFQQHLPYKTINKSFIYNSITTNYVMGVNQDLENLI